MKEVKERQTSQINCCDITCLSKKLQLIEVSSTKDQSELLLLCLNCGMLQNITLKGVLQDNQTTEKNKPNPSYV